MKMLELKQFFIVSNGGYEETLRQLLTLNALIISICLMFGFIFSSSFVGVYVNSSVFSAMSMCFFAMLFAMPSTIASVIYANQCETQKAKTEEVGLRLSRKATEVIELKREIGMLTSKLRNAEDEVSRQRTKAEVLESRLGYDAHIYERALEKERHTREIIRKQEDELRQKSEQLAVQAPIIEKYKRLVEE